MLIREGTWEERKIWKPTLSAHFSCQPKTALKTKGTIKKNSYVACSFVKPIVQ